MLLHHGQLPNGVTFGVEGLGGEGDERRGGEEDDEDGGGGEGEEAAGTHRKSWLGEGERRSDGCERRRPVGRREKEK
jgi:hypothetical protein